MIEIRRLPSYVLHGLEYVRMRVSQKAGDRSHERHVSRGMADAAEYIRIHSGGEKQEQHVSARRIIHLLQHTRMQR